MKLYVSSVTLSGQNESPMTNRNLTYVIIIFL